MYSVLDVRGGWDDIRIYHSSFREYLIDPTRSRGFHVDVGVQKYLLARRWLQNLSVNKIPTYSLHQLHEGRNNDFFQGWIRFCMNCLPEPTRDLLEDLQNVDLSFIWFRFAPVERLDLLTGTGLWSKVYGNLASWVGKYRGVGREADTGLAKSLINRLLQLPKHFHLERSPGVDLPDLIVCKALFLTTCCRPDSPLISFHEFPRQGLRITECRCNLSGGMDSEDPKHLAYQAACMRLLKVFISDFGRLQAAASRYSSCLRSLYSYAIFKNLAGSRLLRHCRLDAELLSLCRTFFGFAQNCELLRAYGREEEWRENLLKWIGTFPESFAEEAESLKVQVISLPWARWA
ncbi:hypothetical protein PM082_017853 [Marasmius tenuissimus]|nr:hypothetical protein PM082_017853 [Marasmius tenuissimus]